MLGSLTHRDTRPILQLLEWDSGNRRCECCVDNLTLVKVLEAAACAWDEPTMKILAGTLDNFTEFLLAGRFLPRRSWGDIVSWVPRDLGEAADKLSKLGRQRKQRVVRTCCPRDCLSKVTRVRILEWR